MKHGEYHNDLGFKNLNLSKDLVIAAHELKTPLVLIRQLSLFLENELDGNNKQLIQQIGLTAERSLSLTTNLTQASNFQPELFPLETVNLRSIITELDYDLSPLCKMYGKKICLRRKQNLPLVIANRELLRRVLTSYVDNALKYSKNKASRIDLDITVLASKKVRIAVRNYCKRVSVKSGENYNLASSGIGLKIVDYFANYFGADTGHIRHKDGNSYYIDLEISSQMRLI